MLNELNYVRSQQIVFHYNEIFKELQRLLNGSTEKKSMKTSHTSVQHLYEVTIEKKTKKKCKDANEGVRLKVDRMMNAALLVMTELTPQNKWRCRVSM